MKLQSVSFRNVHTWLGFSEALVYPEASVSKPLVKWKMEVDDSPIFRYLYRYFRPKRHLEFGTWQGTGAVYCLEECDATVWTINRPGIKGADETCPGYGFEPEELASAQEWAQRIGFPKKGGYRSDALGFIGRHYLERDMGHRVCQIYCDSRQWDTSQYPPGFFDSVLIDGGHEKDVVISDTRKAMEVLRSGGLILWHDFCPPIFECYPHTKGVMEAILQEAEWLTGQTQKLFWINPSWILLGIKK